MDLPPSATQHLLHHRHPPPPAASEILPHHAGSSSPRRNSRPPQQPSSQGVTQACQRCRQHKLRCTREQPSCQRCKRASAACVYPPPPDRKLLAAQRVRKTKAMHAAPEGLSQGPSSLSSQPQQQQQQVLRNSYGPPVSYERHSSSSSYAVNAFPDESQANSFLGGNGGGDDYPLEYEIRGEATMRDDRLPPQPPHGGQQQQPAVRQTAIPSPEVAMLLMEIYFTRVYNANLLFHKDTFLSDYASNRVPNFVSFSIFSLASIFLPRTSRQPQAGNSPGELGISALSISDFGSYAHEWATEATQQVLMQAVEPRLETIQACQTLGLYWFAMNRQDRTHILTHLAYTTSRLLGFHSLTAEAADGDGLQAELRRRCFWSCWITSCISQENACFRAESWNEAVDLPFPCDEASFAAGVPQPRQAFDERGKVISVDGTETPLPPASIMAELVKLFSLWWEIQRFVKRHSERHRADASKRMQGFLLLDRHLEVVYEDLHPDFKFSGPSSFTSPKVDPYKLFLLHCLYRLCGCALHSSIVPILSSTPPSAEISKKLVRMAAEEAMKHSKITLEIAHAFLSTRPDRSRLSSITGYAIFVSSAVQFRSLNAQGKLKAHESYLRAPLSILKQLKEYWTPLRGPLQTMLLSANLDINVLVSIKNHSKSTPADYAPDIERLIASKGISGAAGIASADLYSYVDEQDPKFATPRGSVSAHTNSPDALSQSGSGPLSHASGRKTSRHEVSRTSSADLPRSTPPSTTNNPGPNRSNLSSSAASVTAMLSRRPVEPPSLPHQPYTSASTSNSTPSGPPLLEGFEMMTDVMAMELGGTSGEGGDEGEVEYWWARSFDNAGGGGGGGGGEGEGTGGVLWSDGMGIVISGGMGGNTVAGGGWFPAYP